MATVLFLAPLRISEWQLQENLPQKNLMSAGSQKTGTLKPLESDIHIRYGVNCSSFAFDALQYDTHSAFFDSLPPNPMSVFVYLAFWMMKTLHLKTGI